MDWKEVTVTFNDNKINLPRVAILKLQHKIKARCLMKREPLLFHLMLKQGITWFTLATYYKIILQKLENSEMTIKLIFQMACILRPECNFLNGYFRCLLPVEMVDVEVKVKMMQGIHMFWRDRTSQIIKCSPWSTRLCPYPSLIRKMKMYLELKGNLGPRPRPQSQSQSQPSSSTHPQNINPMTRKALGPKKNDKRRKTVLAKRRYR